MQDQNRIRNVAIIAHVDHGKTTLVDQLFKQSGLFRSNQVVEERLMDSMDLEKERGITIMAKNGCCYYNDYMINIIDTPGHADFGGEVERVLHMADGVLFLVDAVEGPMPQSYFVLKKAVALTLPVIVVVNKIDKPNSRCDWVIDQVFDLLVKLDAPDHILDFPLLYASSKEGYAKYEEDAPHDGTVIPVFESIIKNIPPPTGNVDDLVQFLVSSISYSSFLGRLAIGKIRSGSLKINQSVCLIDHEGKVSQPSRVTKLYRFNGPTQVETDYAQAGDIVAIAGFEGIKVGQTLTSPENPVGIVTKAVDPPTISMNFLPNDSPFSGLEGDYVTSRHLKDRLERELLTDVALHVEELSNCPGFRVSGRGELHLCILIEKMRREGYEFQVSRPSIIVREINGQKMEPYEDLSVDVDEAYMGRVIESLGVRKGQMLEVIQNGQLVRLHYKIPARGLLGYQSQFMTETKGMGVFSYTFLEYGPYCGDIKTRNNGVIVVKETCETVAYALFNIQERGTLFMGPGIRVYEGQIIGENSRLDDMVVNPAKGKKLTNVRASGTDEAVVLIPPRLMTLDQYVTYIEDDELVEVTPKSVRIRKMILKETERRKSEKTK